jgi:hypothetical protein
MLNDGELGGCHDKLGIKTRMVSYLAKTALCNIIMCTWLMGVDGPGVLSDTGLKLKFELILYEKM